MLKRFSLSKLGWFTIVWTIGFAIFAYASWPDGIALDFCIGLFSAILWVKLLIPWLTP